MDADGQAFRLLKQEARRRQQGLRSDCPATITPRNGFASPVPATYHGLGYAGGGTATRTAAAAGRSVVPR
jgi:hypothetical protein